MVWFHVYLLVMAVLIEDLALSIFGGMNFFSFLFIVILSLSVLEDRMKNPSFLEQLQYVPRLIWGTGHGYIY